MTTVTDDDIRLLNGILTINAMRVFSGTNQLSAEEHAELRDLRDRLHASLSRATPEDHGLPAAEAFEEIRRRVLEGGE